MDKFNLVVRVARELTRAVQEITALYNNVRQKTLFNQLYA